MGYDVRITESTAYVPAVNLSRVYEKMCDTETSRMIISNMVDHGKVERALLDVFLGWM